MSSETFKRSSLRAPLKSSFLYETEGRAFLGYSINISEGGILIDKFPKTPTVNIVPIMFELPMVPLLSSLDESEIENLGEEDFERKVLRLKIRMVRTLEDRSPQDKRFGTQIGCEFLRLSERNRQDIIEYVSTSVRNIVFLLHLFEQWGKKKGNRDRIKLVAGLLGYDASEEIGTLWQRVLHDYQGLESL